METTEGAFGAWLQQELDRREWSQADFARRSRLGAQDVSRYINDQRLPTYDKALVIAAHLGIDPDLVVQKAGHPVSRTIRERPRSVDDYLAGLQANMPIAVPKVRQVASAGAGESEIEDYVYLSPRPGRRPKLLALDITGRCMEPDLCAGDTVIVDPEQVATPGRVVVATITEDDATQTVVKRLTERRGVRYLEPNMGEPISVDERVRIVGVVVETRRKM